MFVWLIGYYLAEFENAIAELADVPKWHMSLISQLLHTQHWTITVVLKGSLQDPKYLSPETKHIEYWDI